MCDESVLLCFYKQNEAAMLVDVLRVKVQRLEDLRTARSASVSTASSWPRASEEFLK
jgi:hypothetical protein